MEISFQEIWDVIQKYLPANWNRTAFMANYSEGGYSFCFYVKVGNSYVDYHDLVGNRMEIIKFYKAVNSIISPVRNQLSGKDLWYTMTMIVDADGDFMSEYDYNDVSENFVEYTSEWKKKYLI